MRGFTSQEWPKYLFGDKTQKGLHLINVVNLVIKHKRTTPNSNKSESQSIKQY